MRTRVCITIDTEFSIGGAFRDASRQPVAEPVVWCHVNGRSEGLGFMLEIFRQHDIVATFFVETAHRFYFKHDPMQPIAQLVHDHGHEVQLHTHPCWSLFESPDWRQRGRTERGPDDFSGRSVADSVRLLLQGIDTFRDWGLPRPQAFRSGNLQHDDNLYKALAQVDIRYASNVAVAICDSGDSSYRLYSGMHERHGVIECPVLSFADWRVGGKRHLKSLTIAGSSFEETRMMLEQARAAEIPLVVVLTHPFEYVQHRDLGFQQVRRHSQTQKRLTRLCEFLKKNDDRFEACGFAHAASTSAPGQPDNTLLEGTLRHSLPRMMAQVAYDKLGHLALAHTHRKSA
jgi:hypothetical protein